MDLEVVGRHALLFDDDATAAFINSSDALVDWNSLLIDRYDVRHLLQNPPPPRKRRRHQNSSSSPPLASSLDPLQPELDHERYLDLPSPSDEQELDNGVECVDASGYHAVTFSYGYPDVSTGQKKADAGLECSGFHPPFPVPESLLQSLPPTEKIHQIIARTAMFVSEHGGQSEIVLRVKQGDNPTFGFLMPDHHLHTYFRFLVDNQELLKSDIDGKYQEEEKKADTEDNQAGGVGGSGALSLLGSVYGSGEDEDGATEDAPKARENDSGGTSDALNATIPHGLEQTEFSVNVAGKDDPLPKHPVPSSKEKAASKRVHSIGTVKAGTTSSLKKESDTSGPLYAAAEKSQASALPSTPVVETLILEPPSDLKRLVDKIVEFILKNGKEFEAVLVEQDSKHGRFPFLLPSNQYHPYYLKVIQKAQESKITGKNFFSEKDDAMGHGANKKTALSRESDDVSLGSSGNDMPYDSDKKEKFKMVIGKLKKDGVDPPSKATQLQFGVSVDAAAAAAILQAATRGYKNPNFDFLSKTSLDGISHGLSSEGGQASSFGSLLSSRPQSSNQKPDQNGESSVSVPVAKAIAETAALAAASEADSSEACLTGEQKLKAERLKRAKMFAAMIKSGAAPLKTEPMRGLSVERPESGVSGSGAEVVNLAGKEREGSTVPLEVDTTDKNEKFRKFSDDEYNERRSRRKYRSRCKKHDADDDDEGDDDEERDHKHSRKKHRSHRSSHHSRDRHKHRRRHSSSKDRESRPRHRNDSSSEDERSHKSRSHKHRRRSHSEREVDLEEGEISTKMSDQSKASVSDGASREASLDLSNSNQDGRAPSQPSETTEVSDDLRAKIRAMLMATL